jgi:hypothetical protein
MDPQKTRAERIAERRAAVQAAQARNVALMRVHAILADDLSHMAPAQRAAVVAKALANVQVWETRGVSSPVYARVWRSILREPTAGIARLLDSPNVNTLIRNSPFGFVYSEPKYRTQLCFGNEGQE